MKKKAWFAAGCTAVLLVLILLILLIVDRRQGKAVSIAQGSLYPCTVTQTKQGLLVTVSGGEEGYSWNAATDDPYAVYPAERSATVQKSEVLLCPVSDGSANITLTLENTAPPCDAAYRLSLLVRSSEGRIEVLNTAYRSFPGVIRDAEGRYTIASMADGSCLVCMENGTDSEWVASLESGEAGVRLYRPLWASGQELPDAEPNGADDAEEACFCIEDAGADEACVFVTDRKTGAVLSLAFTRSPDGEFLPTLQEWREPGTGAEAPDAPEWRFPSGTALLETGTAELNSQENGKAIHADYAYIFLTGEAWTLLRAEGQSRKALAARDYRMSEEAPEGEDAAESDARIWVFRADESWRGAWESGDTAYLLTATDADRDALEAAAGILMEQQP